jgi:hypothetical protein
MSTAEVSVLGNDLFETGHYSSLLTKVRQRRCNAAHNSFVQLCQYGAVMMPTSETRDASSQ